MLNDLKGEIKRMKQTSVLIRLLVVAIIASMIFSLYGSNGELTDSNAGAASMSPQVSALVESVLSYGYINSNVHAVQESSLRSNLPFVYETSIGTFENIVFSDLQKIAEYKPFLSFLTNYSESGNPYISEGMTYNFTTQSYGIYVMPLVSEGQNQTTFSFAYSSLNKTVYGPLISSGETLPFSKKVYSPSWAGYGFYESGRIPITEIESSINIPNISLPSKINPGVREVGISAWVGISPTYNGSNPGFPSGTALAQAIWQAVYNYNGVFGTYSGPYYTILTEIWNGGLGYVSQNFPGISANVNPGWSTQFDVIGNSNSSVTFSVIDNAGGSYFTTQAGSYVFAQNSSFADFVAEPPSSGFYQVPVFSPDIYFNGSYIQDINGVSPTLDSLHTSGYYDEYILNQTGGSDQNIIDSFVTTQYNGEIVLQYNNSNY